MDEPKVAFWDYASITRSHDPYMTSIEELANDLYGMAGDNLPKEVEIIGYNPVKINIEEKAEWILDVLLGNLDEEYVSYDGERPAITMKMKQAAKEFVEKVAEDYDVSVCEEVCRKIINPKDYLRDVK